MTEFTTLNKTENNDIFFNYSKPKGNFRLPDQSCCVILFHPSYKYNLLNQKVNFKNKPTYFKYLPSIAAKIKIVLNYSIMYKSLK